jgi:hypothetical protein
MTFPTNLFLLALLQLSPQPSQQGGALEGIVIKLGSTEPLPGTRVGLAKAEGGPASQITTTDANGRFRFTDVAAGIYRVLATRNDGYLPAEYGQSRPTARGVPIQLGPGQTTPTVQVAMAPTASITGRVFDHDGDPVGQAQVVALRSAYNREGRRIQTIAQSVQTNDLGEYRLFWLPPGQYYLTAKPVDVEARSVQAYIRPPDNQTIHDQTSAPVIVRRMLESGEVIEQVQVPVYFPGTLDIQAARLINIRIGDNIRGADINLVEMPRSRQVRGTVMDATTGQPVTAGVVRAILQSTGPTVTLLSGAIDAKGNFELSGFVAGRYSMFAVPGGTGGFLGGRAGWMTVDVNAQDLENVAIIVPPPFTVSGRIIVEGQNSFDLTRMRVFISRKGDVLGMPFPQRSVQAGLPDPNAVSPEGTFKLPDVGPGDYTIGVNYPGAQTYLKSARLGDIDVLNDGLHLAEQPERQLEIVIGTEVGAINGTVLNDARDSVVNAVIALVPETSARGRKELYKTGGSDQTGRFSITSIPPGDYKVFAWDEVERAAWLDPAFLQPYESQGVSIHVGAGSREQIQLTVIKTRR